MNHEDNFLRDLLKDQPPLTPPSADYQQGVMQRVAALPVHQNRRSNYWMLVGGILLTLAFTLTAGYLLLTYWPTVLATVESVLRWLSWDIDPTWVLMGVGYGLLARALLTFGVLAAVDRRHTRWMMVGANE